MAIQFRQILFPTDFSEVAPNAVETACFMARIFGATLHCLHVMDDGYQCWSTLGPETVPVGPSPDQLVDMGTKRMERFVSEHLGAVGGPLITDVVMGRPFAEIIAYARENEIDLIVMGTHGRGAIAHALLGSTAEKVVRKSPCAVLTVRASGHEFQMP